MSISSEDNYAAAIGRSMWRIAKRRAISLLQPSHELTRAACAGAPENKAQPLVQSSQEGAGAPTTAPTTLREFLRKLAAEPGSTDQGRGAS